MVGGLADVESEVDVVAGGVFHGVSLLDPGEVGVVVVEDHWWSDTRRGHPRYEETSRNCGREPRPY